MLEDQVYNKLKSQSARLSVVKEQIYLGLGWVDADHPWLANREAFNSKHLLKHLIQTVLPLTEKFKVPHDAPIHFPTPTDLMVLGTESELSFQFKYVNENVIDDVKTSARAKRKHFEDEEKMDRWSLVFNAAKYNASY
jgi:hypothetical protein